MHPSRGGILKFDGLHQYGKSFKISFAKWNVLARDDLVHQAATPRKSSILGGKGQTDLWTSDCLVGRFSSGEEIAS